MHRGKRQHHKATTTPPCESIQKQIPLKLIEETVRRRKAAESGEVETPFGFHSDVLHFFFSGIPCHLEAPPSSLFFIYKALARVISVLK